MNSNCSGGIIIIPLNFLSSIRKADIQLREKFIKKFNVNIINIFEENVFEDTSYTICSFLFTLKKNETEGVDNVSTCYIYPYNKNFTFVLNSYNNYTIGG